MVDFLQQKLTGFTKIAGVDLTLLAEGLVYNVVIIENKKGLLNIIKEKSSINSTEELILFLEEEIPVALSISGKGILHKKVESREETHAAHLLSQVIPNAKASDFYLQNFDSGQAKILSIMRKPALDEIVTLF